MRGKLLSILTAILMMCSTALPAQAAVSNGYRNSQPTISAENRRAPQKDSTTINRAIDLAFKGEVTPLAALLDSSDAEKVQAILRERLTERGDFNFEKSTTAMGKRPKNSQPGPAGLKSHLDKKAILNTGQYEYTCTAYNGVTMGWQGKTLLACHGWLDTYISGNHVAHYNPDLIPRGKPISVGCFVSVASGVVTVLSLPAGGSVGWAMYGIGVLLSSAGIVISCP